MITYGKSAEGISWRIFDFVRNNERILTKTIDIFLTLKYNETVFF